MPCASAQELPEGRHLIRVLPQALTAEVGPEGGCWRVPSGWYYTDIGRSRVSAAVDVWQSRVVEMEAKVEALEVAIARPPVRHPQTQPGHDPASFATASVCLGIGFLLGRVFPRHHHSAPDAR